MTKDNTARELVIEHLDNKIKNELDKWQAELHEFLVKHIRKISPNYGFNTDLMIEAVFKGMNKEVVPSYKKRRVREELDRMISASVALKDFIELKNEMDQRPDSSLGECVSGDYEPLR